MKRREVLGSAFLGSGLVWSLGYAQAKPRVRPNILAASQETLVVLSYAVKKMKSLPATNPMSWDFLAAVHSYITAFRSKADAINFASNPTTPESTASFVREIVELIDFDKLGAVPESVSTTWDKCIHHGDQAGVFVRKGHFLSWHRQFLLVFENALISAMQSESNRLGVTVDLALPYWDYFSSPTLPESFRRTHLPDGSPNYLYISFRDPGVNRLLNPSEVGPFEKAAFAMKDLMTHPWKIDEERVVNGFDEGIEVEPHDTLHGQIGGLMGAVVTSSWDPIFWLHHANIDRLWAGWAATLDSVPPDIDVVWRERSFSYPTSNGVVAVTAGELLKTESLGYTYASLDMPSVTSEAITSKALPPQLAIQNTNSSKGLVPSMISRPLSLSIPKNGGGISLNIESSKAKNNLQSLATGNKSASTIKSVSVVFDGLQLSADGYKHGVVYDVVLFDIRSKATHRIGRINKFNFRCFDKNLCGNKNSETLRFDLTGALEKLSPLSKMDLSSIQIYLLSLQDTKNLSSDEVSRVLLTVESVWIDASENPTK
jgi:Common central domain of tyrosinase